MSMSLDNSPRTNKTLTKEGENLKIPIKRQESHEKPKNHLKINYLSYKNDKKIVNKNLLILNYITNESERNNTAKTNISNLDPEKINYELNMLKRYDENLLNSSLSFISEFDLESDNENKLNDSFSSCDNEDNGIEEIEIKAKSSKNLEHHHIFDDEYDDKLMQEFDEIKDFLNKKVRNV